MLALAIDTLFILFFGDQGLEKHEGRCFALRALDASVNVDQFSGALVAVRAGGKIAGCPISGLDRKPQGTRDGHQRCGLGSAFSIQEFVDHCSIEIRGARAIRLGPASTI